MKKLILLLLLAGQSAFAQKEAADFKVRQLNNKAFLPNEFKAQFAATDFSSLFTKTANENVFGFIGDDYQRIRVKIISVSKSKSKPYTYHVYGKSMVKTNIDQFSGTLQITNILKQKVMSYGIDDMYKNRGDKGEYVIVGNYMFSEPRNEKHSGIFKGVFRSFFYLDKHNHMHYDDIQLGDSYNNNQFVGVWKSYDGKFVQRCNWGDWRIPDSGDFDSGAGDFSPGKNIQNGWTTYVDQYNSSDKKLKEKAKAAEKAKWWL